MRARYRAVSCQRLCFGRQPRTTGEYTPEHFDPLTVKIKLFNGMKEVFNADSVIFIPLDRDKNLSEETLSFYLNDQAFSSPIAQG